MEYTNTMPSIINEITAQTNTISAADLTDAFATAIGTGIAVIILAFLFFVACLTVALCVVKIISYWKIFTKAGEKGWKALIPIYNLVVIYRISGVSPLLLLLYAIFWIPIIGPISIFALTIYLSHNLAKSFGKDIGYTVGLTVPSTSWIFYLILGFGKDEYVGQAGETKVVTESASTTKENKAEIKIEPKKVVAKSSATKKTSANKKPATKKATTKATTTKKASTTKNKKSAAKKNTTTAKANSTTKKSPTTKKPATKKTTK